MTVHRIGIVGSGLITAIHVEAIRAAPNAELAGIMDRGSGRGAELAPAADHRHADDLEAFVAREDIDAITVATPSGVHLDAALAAARAGKHCLVEKPMEITVERIDAMIEAHRAAGTVLGGIFNTRFSTGAQLLLRTARSGRFGRLTFASASGPWWREDAYYDGSDWKGTWALDGGGALMNQGIHSVDLLQWIVGSPPVRVAGRIATLAHPQIEVEDTAAATIEFANGALGTLSCTTSMWPGHFRTLTVAGTDGTATLADGNVLFWQFREPSPADDALADSLRTLPGAGIGASDPSAGVDAEGHRAVLERFLAAIERGETPEIDGAESRKAVEIIRSIYASSRNGGAPVELQPVDDAR